MCRPTILACVQLCMDDRYFGREDLRKVGIPSQLANTEKLASYYVRMNMYLLFENNKKKYEDHHKCRPGSLSCRIRIRSGFS
jgi:hypothetical protein